MYKKEGVIAEIDRTLRSVDNLIKFEKLEEELDHSVFEDAMVRAVEVVGGVIKMLVSFGVVSTDDEFWKKWIGIRDKISHIYAGVDIERIRVAAKDAALAKEKLLQIKESVLNDR